MPLAVPPWQFDSESPLSAPHLTTNQQVPQPSEPSAFWHARCISPKREAVAMSGMQSLNGLSDPQSQFSGKRSRSSILKIEKRIWTMCTLNEAGRRFVCANVRELRPVREG